MKYHIDTIPVWDAFRAGGECPLCDIRLKIENEFIGGALGGSVMEPGVRVKVNESGFCADHLNQLYAAQNRLGLALMLHTHLKEVIGALDGRETRLLGQLDLEEKKSAAERAVRSVLKNAPSAEIADGPAGEIEKRSGGCFICDRIDSSMERYILTIIAMWENETDFRKAVEASKGFCLEHYWGLINCGSKRLSGKSRREFLTALAEIQRENFDRIEKELEWYTLKFDYRNKDKPWGDSRDAVERTMLKLRGARPRGREEK